MKNNSIKSSFKTKSSKTSTKLTNTFLINIIVLIFFFTNNSLSLRSISNSMHSQKSNKLEKTSYHVISKRNSISENNDKQYLNRNFIDNTDASKALLEINQIYTSDDVSPIKVFLNTISLTNEKAFCIKRLLGKPITYKSYKCPSNMRIYSDLPDVCIKDCPSGLIRGEENCEAICNKGFIREYDLCVDKFNNSNYKPDFAPLVKADPICINGFFSNGFCYTCLGNSEHSNGQCVSPCFSGSPSDNFCSYTDDANRNLSLINEFWARFFRSLFNELLKIVKSEIVSKDLFKNFADLREIAKFIMENKKNQEVQIISGKIMTFLRDKFKINLNENWQSYLRSILLKLLMRFEKNELETRTKVLAVVDDIIFFSGDYTDGYLENKNYGLESLPETIANILDLMC